MKNCQRLRAHAFLLVLLFSWSGLVLDVQGQQPIDDAMPREFSEREVMQTIARLQSKMYTPSKIGPILKLQLDVLKSEATFHSRMNEELQKMLSISDAQATEYHQKVSDIISKAESSTGMPLVDRETTALQMRNCVIELQRIEWEIAAEKGLSESKIPDAQTEVDKLNIEARRAELVAMAAELQALKQKLSEDHPKIKEQTAKMRAVEASVAEAMARFNAESQRNVARAGLVAGTTNSDSAVRVSQLIERKKAITSQVEMLKAQREVWMSIESKQAELSNLRKRSEAIAEMQTQSDLRQLSRKSTIAAIEDAFKNIGVDDSELPKHEK